MTQEQKNKRVSLLLAAGLTLMTGHAQAELNLSNVPLFSSTGVDPNIMFLLDNSGSMYNIVPEAPYDPTIEYTNCPAGKTFGPKDGTQFLRVYAIVDSDNGESYFYQQGRKNIDGRGGSKNGFFNWGTGAASSERCFASNELYLAALYTDATANVDGNNSGNENYPKSYLPSLYSGNYLNWYFGQGPSDWGDGTARSKPGTERRIDIARDAADTLVRSLDGVRLGLSTYDSIDGVRILVDVDDLSSSHRNDLLAEINSLQPAGITPLGKSLHEIGRYFIGESGNQYDGPLTLYPNGVETVRDDDVIFNSSPSYNSGVSSASPIEYFCQQSFAVLLTDGRPQLDYVLYDSNNKRVETLDASTLLKDYDGDCPNGNDGVTCEDSDRKISAPYEYEDYGSDYLDDIAKAVYEIDLRPDLVDFDGDPVVNNLTTYTIGFADTLATNDPLMQDTAANGGGLFLRADNASELFVAFQDATSDIFENTEGSSAAVATNSGSISSDSRLYQARFDSSDWSGQLLAYRVHDGNNSGGGCSVSDPIGTVCDSVLWDAGEELLNLSPAERKIVTWDAGNRQGIPFQWLELTNEQRLQLSTNILGLPDTMGDERLAFLRGDHSNEQQQGGALRTREHRNGDINDPSDNKRLGDIVHSAPVFVGSHSAFNYPDDWGTGAAENGSPYSSFRSSSSYMNRDPMVYVGANDGMLHAFDASNGRERFAYVPGPVYENLSQFTDPGYTHRYYVDGSPTVVDAYVNGAWKTILATNLRAGGQGIFALDVTTPPGTSASETAVAAQVLWEFTDDDDADLGYVFGEVSIARMKNGKWAAIVGNGYNNTKSDGTVGSGTASLFIIDLDDGSLIRKLDTLVDETGDSTGFNRPNGLAAPAPVDIDGDYIVDFIYAGDLFGNMWKFDVSSSDKDAWGVAYGTSSEPAPLFTALDGDNNPQPITTRPQVGKHPLGVENGVMVYFGTGKYIEVSDNSGSNEFTQSFYGIWDKNQLSLTEFDRGHLLQQEIIREVSYQDKQLRVSTDNEISWHTDAGLPSGSPPTTHLGWYLDLLNAQGGNTDNMGERQASNPVLRNGRIIFTTLVPNDLPCAFGGLSWLMEFDASNGSRLEYSPFDLDNNKIFDTEDFVEVTMDNGDKILVPMSGMRSSVGIISTPAILQYSNEAEMKFTSGSSGKIGAIRENSGPGAVGRQSWRELR